MSIQRGAIIGAYQGRPIHESLTVDGTVMLYDRIAIEDANGNVELEQLADDECVVSPGLIYKRAPIGSIAAAN